jgi:8-oxo-dGTP diphosphatase
MSRAYPERPIVGVGAVVWCHDKVLLIRRAKPPRVGSWSIPGGAQKVGETVFEAARREIMEETTIDIRVLGLVDVVDSIRHDENGRVQYHYTLVDVVGEWRDGEPTPLDDAAEAAWFDLDQLDTLDMWSETIRVIHLAHDKRTEFTGIDRD